MTRGSLSAHLWMGVHPPQTISAAHALLVVRAARHSRMAKVKRHGRRGARWYELTPRNRSEWRMARGRL